MRATPGWRLRVAGLAVALGTVLTACESQAIAGPLRFGDGGASVCLPGNRGERLLVGDFFTAPDDSEITITAVELDNPRGATLERAWISPTLDGVLGGSVYPPVDSPAWAAREPAVGTTVPKGEQRNLVLLVRRDSQNEATTGLFAISYRYRNIEYRRTGSIELTIADECF